MKNRIFKLKIKDEEGKEKFIIMGDSYKKFEEHFSDLVSTYTKRWHYDDSKEGKGKCLGRTLDIEILEIWYSESEFVSYGGVKWCLEEVYDNEVEDHNIHSRQKYCPYLRHIKFVMKPKEYLDELLKKNGVKKKEDIIIRKHITFCYDSSFYGIECLEKEDQYGFFKDENDIRPSSCTWINKEDAEKVGALLYNRFKDMIGEASLNEAIVNRKVLLNLMDGLE